MEDETKKEYIQKLNDLIDEFIEHLEDIEATGDEPENTELIYDNAKEFVARVKSEL